MPGHTLRVRPGVVANGVRRAATGAAAGLATAPRRSRAQPSPLRVGPGLEDASSRASAPCGLCPGWPRARGSAVGSGLQPGAGSPGRSTPPPSVDLHRIGAANLPTAGQNGGRHTLGGAGAFRTCWLSDFRAPTVDCSALFFFQNHGRRDGRDAGARRHGRAGRA